MIDARQAHSGLSVSKAVVVGLAAAAALAPVPAPIVERFYSSSVFPVWQSWMTAASNAVPFAVFDCLIVAVALAWLWALVADVRRRPSHGRWRMLWRLVSRTVVWSAALYMAFLASWGLNYRRIALEEKLGFQATRVSTAAAEALAALAAARMNALYAPAHAAGWLTDPVVDRHLASAFSEAERALGATRFTVPSRPKHSWLDLYFRRAVVDGMTDPFFLETLVAGDLLPFERPFVTAHEWAHLAGYAHEGEANFVGWLACLRGGEAHQYSGWLFLYNEAGSTLPRPDRANVAARLAPGPRADLRAVSDRVARNASPRVAAAGWRVYNQYLKANRVESGIASYTEVLRLILGTRFNPIPPA